MGVSSCGSTSRGTRPDASPTSRDVSWASTSEVLGGGASRALPDGRRRSLIPVVRAGYQGWEPSGNGPSSRQEEPASFLRRPSPPPHVASPGAPQCSVACACGLAGATPTGGLHEEGPLRQPRGFRTDPGARGASQGCKM